ncbi:FAD-binding protein [Amphritea sp. 1_MG-2023]|uniref:electron transfer flavoprotein subunit alpha/FixB family protein n=1 Tax=Amphritea sp. 1_MG-2023 TaxID=3062670 RepID=UPI0026E478F4|nr:FAD-binding protein [Amphritea sp. 1_MG-2023]MDO6562787.1 FAD-binding protein [Amphritea sp. 1_MG-2023]
MTASILVIADHNNAQLNAVTLNTLQAAVELKAATGSAISVLVAGHQCDTVATEAAAVADVDQVIVIDDATLQNQLAESVAPAVVALTQESSYSHILSAATSFGKDLLPRVAALLDVSQISEIIEVVDAETFVRPIYAGNALATIKSSDAIKVMSVRGTAFDAVAATGGAAEQNRFSVTISNELSRFVSEEKIISERPELTSAAIIISGGRGMQSGENFPMLEKVADKLGAAVGASRAAVDAGFVANDMQVGQTGKIVAPDLYIAVGISGAIQHLAGMKDSKVIVAINKDVEAPIFGVADYGLVADLFEAVPELEQSLS